MKKQRVTIHFLWTCMKQSHSFNKSNKRLRALWNEIFLIFLKFNSNTVKWQTQKLGSNDSSELSWSFFHTFMLMSVEVFQWKQFAITAASKCEKFTINRLFKFTVTHEFQYLIYSIFNIQYKPYSKQPEYYCSSLDMITTSLRERSISMACLAWLYFSSLLTTLIPTYN